MTRRPTKKAAPESKEQHERAVLNLAPGQLRALRQEAAKRVLESGGGRMDASAVARDIIAAWMVRRG